MTNKTYDVLGVGNAIVDILAVAEDSFLAEQGMAKGSMALVDEDRAHAIYQAMGPCVEASGGSAANTIAGVASFGSSTAFIGKTRDDEFGKIFAHDLRSLGVAYETSHAAQGAATARCLVVVTPDAQRTMNTHLGACVDLGPDDIDPAMISASAITYLEGYLFDPPGAKDAFRKAAALAAAHGRQIALTLSDSFCVDRYRDEFCQFIRDHVDIVFANEAEIAALFPGCSLMDAANQLARLAKVSAITRSEKGSLLVRAHERIEVPAIPVAQLVDTTGAGDQYAAGVLHGMTRGLPLGECGMLGSMAAAEVISHYGARPETPLAELCIPA